MTTLHSFLLLFANLLVSFAQEDLQKKVFIFPEESNTAVVVLKAPLQQPLASFTVCLKYYTLLTREYALFSYATKQHDNELLLFKPKPNQYRLYLGASTVTFLLPEKKDSKPSWEHICVSWESCTGLVQMWLDGEPLPRMGMRKGHSIDAEASIVLGQDQDNFGGGFAANQAFVGEMTDVYMWDRVLSVDEVGLVSNGHILSNYLINWRSLNYVIRDYVVVQPSLI